MASYVIHDLPYSGKLTAQWVYQIVMKSHQLSYMLLHWKDHILAVIYVISSIIYIQSTWNISKKDAYVDASNVCKAMKDCGPCSYACFTHSLQ